MARRRVSFNEMWLKPDAGHPHGSLMLIMMGAPAPGGEVQGGMGENMV